MMTKFAINSECGLSVIEATDINSAKESYEIARHYDFDAASETEASWYSISDDTTGEVLESVNC